MFSFDATSDEGKILLALQLGSYYIEIKLTMRVFKVLLSKHNSLFEIAGEKNGENRFSKFHIE